MVNLFIVYDAWSRYLSGNVSLSDCLFGSVKLTNNADPYKNGHSRLFYQILCILTIFITRY